MQTNIFDRFKVAWRKTLKSFLYFGDISQNNHVKIFHDGDEAFREIFQEISQAESSIFIETYIFEPDSVGQKIRDLLIKACERKVNVTLIYDYFGSSGLKEKFLRPLVDANARILAFNPIWPWRRKGPLLFRDHRKLIVVDDKVAFCGGMNISCHYAGKTLGTDFYRDSMAKITGGASKDLQKIILQSLEESTLTPLEKVTLERKTLLRRFSFKDFSKSIKVKKLGQNAAVQVLQSNSRKNIRNIQESMEKALSACYEYCYFTSPFFLPYKKLRNAIVEAKKRGVDVRVLTSGISDVPLLRFANQYLYYNFLKNGVKIYEYNGKTLHAKLCAMDDIYTSIGSYNLDTFSHKRNLEVNVAIIAANTTKDLKKQFLLDLESAQEITYETFKEKKLFSRLISWIVYQFFTI